MAHGAGGLNDRSRALHLENHFVFSPVPPAKCRIVGIMDVLVHLSLRARASGDYGPGRRAAAAKRREPGLAK